MDVQEWRKKNEGRRKKEPWRYDFALLVKEANDGNPEARELLAKQVETYKDVISRFGDDEAIAIFERAQQPEIQDDPVLKALFEFVDIADFNILKELVRKNNAEKLQKPIRIAPTEPTATQAEAPSGRAKKVTAAILIIVGVLISIATNVASNTMPVEWKPFLWISWPLIGVLVLISIVLLRWQ